MNLITAQARTIFSLRATWVYLALVFFGMGAGPTLYSALAGPIEAPNLLVSSDLAVIVMVAGAAMTVGSEHARGMVGWQYLSTQRRAGLVLSQSFLLWVAFLVAALTGVALAWVGASVVGGVDMAGFEWSMFSAPVLEWSVFTLLAAGLAGVLRSGAFATVIVLADILVLEFALSSIPSDTAHQIAAWMPLMNVLQLGGIDMGFDRPTWLAGLTLAVTVGATLGGAVLVAKRRAVR